MPAQQQAKVQQIAIKVNGTDLPIQLLNGLLDVEVESSLYLPSMFTMRFHDDGLETINSERFTLGASVEIMMSDLSGMMKPVMKGEITAVEPDFGDNFLATIVVRGYDRIHRLNRGSKARVFVNSKDSDIASKIAQQNGLTATTDVTSQVYEHVYQDHQTDFDFLQDRARRNGFEVFVDDKTLYFRKPKGGRGEIALEWGRTLRSFRPRMSASGQVNEVTVKGWDPKQKKEIIGQAGTSDLSPQIGDGKWGGQAAQTAFSAATKIEIRHPVYSQSEADQVAQSILDNINASFIEAEGVAFGNPDMSAGQKVTLSKLGTRFSGKYMVTSVRHVYTLSGYDTYFTVEGTRPRTFADLVTDNASKGRGRWEGVVPAIVTANDDQEGKMARVKVKFPWLDSGLESTWARVTGIGAGNNRGLYWLPEVNDEVLVAFEHGSFDHPYVIGSLWNGTDAPPEQSAVNNGAVEKRTLKTTEGHIIRLTDGSSSKIEIIDSKSNTSIVMDTTNKKITITSQGDIEVTATGKVMVNATQDVTVKATGNMNLEATGNLSLKGMNVSVEANAQLNLKGAIGNLQSSGPMAVKGAVVNIN
jgi:phage protein D/phage baseplate assembly protein gpV